jgi:hypothetical protein
MTLSRGVHLDVGGSLSEWVDNVAEYEDGLIDWGRLRPSVVDRPAGYKGQFTFEMYEDSLVHDHAASDWDDQTSHDRKTACSRGWLERVGVISSVDHPG